MGRKYWNRSKELERLINVLRNQGIYGIEELTRQFSEMIKGYARQLQISELRKEEIEYIWIRLLD